MPGGGVTEPSFELPFNPLLIEYFAKAFQLREHASEREKLQITADYYENATGELEKSAQTYEEMIQNYPRGYRAHLDLGNLYTGQGQYDKAYGSYRQSLRLAPDNVAPYLALATTLLSLQRFDEARQTIQEAQARKLDNYILRKALFALAFLGSDSAAMAEQQQWYATTPDYENFGLALASDTEAYKGHLSKARELIKQAVNSAIRADSRGNRRNMAGECLPRTRRLRRSNRSASFGGGCVEVGSNESERGERNSACVCDGGRQFV